MASSTAEKVLDTAQLLIDRHGYDGFSVADLVATSGVSNGSIYHHFGTKDGVLGELLLRAVEDYQDAILAVLDQHPDDPETGIRALVAAHLQWIENHPRQGRLLLEYRHVVTAEPYRCRLQEMNRVFLRRHESWLEEQFGAGRLPRVEVEAAHAIVFAPAQEVSRRWLTQRSATAPATFAAVLGTAAWAAMSSL